MASIWLCAFPAAAQDNEALAKAAQNPIASMISVPFQNNTNFNFGPEEGTQNILNIQPVLPIELNDQWNVITRTIIPVISQPALMPGQGRRNGLGDLQVSAFLSPSAPPANGWIWGVGAIAQLDTASSDRLGAGAWGLGPTAVTLKTFGPWLVGGLINNVWSVSTDRDDVNQMLVQPFINYNFPDKPGRYLTFAPLITANWKADNGNKWTVPLGLGIGQVTRFGKQPVNMQASVYYNVVRPDFGADWQLRLQLQLMFPK
ncbi:MAG: neuromedin U [Xanthomonadales bacterium]|nr:neuromedin U [Gammaproteobacteria bacterium]MBT8074170.1 neuromedin U [Gammaproteobacteria bacterium]NNK05022.1 neuromedin U [Xanthomonadales bacterium]NNK99982.1 neuromedin U [Xanthomonadales bacterium]